MCEVWSVLLLCHLLPSLTTAVRGGPSMWWAFQRTCFSTVEDEWSSSWWDVVITEQCPARNDKNTSIPWTLHSNINTCISCPLPL